MVRVLILANTPRGLSAVHMLQAMPFEDDIEISVTSEREGGDEPRYYDTIKDFCYDRGLRFYEPGEEIPQAFDLALAVHWRRMTDPAFVKSLRLGLVVIHDGLLPKYRGCSPTVWAIENGETEVGATMFYANDEADAGDIIDQIRVAITDSETVRTIFNRVSTAYEKLIRNNMQAVVAGAAARTPQDHAQATTFPRRTDEHNLIDLSKPGKEIWNKVRALQRPYGGAYLLLNGVRIKIKEACL